MFGTQNLNMPLLPGAQQNLFCGYGYYTGWCYGYYTGCGYHYYTGGCGYVYYTFCHYGYISVTATIYEQAQACPPLSQGPPVAGGPGGDPVEALQALRRQLEVALAGVEAQERVLREQRAAAGGEAAPPRARPGARGQRSE
jgi:hypothetical protein